MTLTTWLTKFIVKYFGPKIQLLYSFFFVVFIMINRAGLVLRKVSWPRFRCFSQTSIVVYFGTKFLFPIDCLCAACYLCDLHNCSINKFRVCSIIFFEWSILLFKSERSYRFFLIVHENINNKRPLVTILSEFIVTKKQKHLHQNRKLQL